MSDDASHLEVLQAASPACRQFSRFFAAAAAAPLQPLARAYSRVEMGLLDLFNARDRYMSNQLAAGLRSRQ